MLDPNEVADLRAFLDEMNIDTEEQYQSSMDHTCDQCLNCDLFVVDESVYGWMVQCRLTDVPTTCGGPYHRK